MSTFSFNALYYSLSLVLLIFSVIHNEYVNFPKRATLGSILLLACTFVWVSLLPTLHTAVYACSGQHLMLNAL
jgi:hypothetical protein